MARIRFSGPFGLRMSGYLALSRIAMGTYVRHLFGRRLVASWDANMEIGALFWRRQWIKAFAAPDMTTARAILDSVQTETPYVYDVDVREVTEPRGVWYLPRQRNSAATVLYLHGGGYGFYGAMNRRLGQMLAHRIGAPVFAPDYRLTPEHPHPAQAEDAMAAWEYVTKELPRERVVVIGDSAGGHMMLMLLVALGKEAQPALGIGLCPWTDIGARGDSLTSNDRYDLVQGWMAVRFGEWLDPEGRYGRAALSPIDQDFAGLAPVYLQAGGREVLRDMIVEFAEVQRAKGADVTLDVWPDMYHDFQLLDGMQEASVEAVARISQIVRQAVPDG